MSEAQALLPHVTFERHTDRARRVIVLAHEEARLLSHDYIGTEHLLLGLIREGEGVAAQALAGISLEAARQQVEDITGRGQNEPGTRFPFTPRAKKVVEFSLREALQLGCSYVGTEHILLGLMREGDGVGVTALVNLGTEAAHVRAKVLEILRGYEEQEPAGPPRVYQATVHETTLGSIRLGHGKLGPHAVIVGPQECVHRISPAEAREAAAALTAVADEIDASGG